MPSGGKRENAGRKASPDGPRVSIPCRVSMKTAETLSGLARETGYGRGQLLDMIVSWFIEDCEREAREFSDRKC